MQSEKSLFKRHRLWLRCLSSLQSFSKTWERSFLHNSNATWLHTDWYGSFYYAGWDRSLLRNFAKKINNFKIAWIELVLVKLACLLNKLNRQMSSVTLASTFEQTLTVCCSFISVWFSSLLRIRCAYTCTEELPRRVQSDNNLTHPVLGVSIELKYLLASQLTSHSRIV